MEAVGRRGRPELWQSWRLKVLLRTSASGVESGRGLGVAAAHVHSPTTLSRGTPAGPLTPSRHRAAGTSCTPFCSGGGRPASPGSAGRPLATPGERKPGRQWGRRELWSVQRAPRPAVLRSMRWQGASCGGWSAGARLPRCPPALMHGMSQPQSMGGRLVSGVSGVPRTTPWTVLEMC